MDAHRVEKLVAQVLDETRAFRQETNEKLANVKEDLANVKEDLANVKEDLANVKRDLGLVKLAVTEHSREIAELRDGQQRIEAKLDSALADQEARIIKLEGAAE